MKDIKWAIIVDGLRIKKTKNISAEYNAVFAIAETDYGCSIIEPHEFDETYEGVVVFEPGFIPEGPRRRLLMSLLFHRPIALVYVDDVYRMEIGLQFGEHLGCLALSPYPELLPKRQIITWPHSVARAFCDTPTQASARSPDIVVAGQSSSVLYPLREGIRRCEPALPLIDVAAPDYSTGVCTDVTNLCTVLDSSRCAFVGGGEAHVLVSKHLEFAVRGGIVVTDMPTAVKAKALGLACIGIDRAEDIRPLVKYIPGEMEKQNQECIQRCHRTDTRVQSLYVLLLGLVRSFWTVESARRACVFPLSNMLRPKLGELFAPVGMKDGRNVSSF